jgi:ABC-type branched-subunit amino acid transport system substrate-binding protein
MGRGIGRVERSLSPGGSRARASARAAGWIAAVGLLLPPPPASAEQGEILLGMSTALSGPAAELGENMKIGVLAALEEANRGGGVGGRPLRLVALDDQYEPAQTVPNMRELIAEKQVVAVVGNVGTPTAVAAVPIANEAKTPFYGAFTGAGVLRKRPPDRYVINYRASYAEETAAMVDALVSEAGLRVNEIAFFTQRDAYGDAGFVGGIAALRRHGLESEHDVTHGRYERNTLAVENGLAEVLQADPPPRAVIMVGAYAPCARFIELARDVGLDALFLNVSFVGAAPLAAALGEKGEGVIVTQVVPHFEADLPIVSAYREALAALDAQAPPTFGSLEGYVAASILIRALHAIEGPPTREAIVNALEGLGEFDVGLGVALRLAPDEHQASHTVWPTILRGGKVLPLDWAELGGSSREAARAAR